MTHEISEYIIIDGHKVDAAIIDRFFDMRTGERVTDAEWDRDTEILAAAEAVSGGDNGSA